MITKILFVLSVATVKTASAQVAEQNSCSTISEREDGAASVAQECVEPLVTEDNHAQQIRLDDGTVETFTREKWTTQHLNENRTIHDLWFNLKCDVVFEKPRPIPSKEQFEVAVQLYNSIVDEESLHLTTSTSGVLVDLEVKQVEGKGRGIFAAKDISKGQLAWYPYAAVFYKAEDYRKFILGLEVSMACDVLQWAYAAEDEETDYYVAVDLNDFTMCNDGGEEQGNIGCDEGDPAMDCDESEGYILRAIKMGEELLCIYAHFSDEESWEEMGLEDSDD